MDCRFPYEFEGGHVMVSVIKQRGGAQGGAWGDGAILACMHEQERLVTLVTLVTHCGVVQVPCIYVHVLIYRYIYILCVLVLHLLF